MTPQQRKQNRDMRREQVERCLAADMPVKEWCELNHVPVSTMYYWMARLRKEEPDLFEDPTCGEWIELSRGSIAARTALAVRGDEAAADATGVNSMSPTVAGSPPADLTRRTRFPTSRSWTRGPWNRHWKAPSVLQAGGWKPIGVFHRLPSMLGPSVSDFRLAPYSVVGHVPAAPAPLDIVTDHYDVDCGRCQ